ncbi:hypothetical protein [Methanobacterium formicicum]|jgi:hypothetical protein|uniref:Uncharacterized protein n=1 Tax=Methanobacterium formicicum TaxID=2162 RepID=A0A0S4FP40_METFO|nr:hypothetical protein [Methanobacterium formicicum]CEL24786.1 hypothetical protein MB9_1148 [Methanobacterium formicicum]
MLDLKHSFSAYSSLFNIVDNLIFVRSKLAHKVDWIVGDSNDLNLKIRNEGRLKNKLFKEIFTRYNQRIDNYKLNFYKLSNSDIKNLEIMKYKLVSDKIKDKSGHYSIYPRTFFCNKCGDLRIFDNNRQWEKFNPERCRKPNCDGKYQQTSLVKYCEQCGNIEPLRYYCKEHGKEHWKLIRTDIDAPMTWKVVCTECQKKGEQPFDILKYSCDHKVYGKKICNKSFKKFKPLVVMEGSVFNSVVITVVDVPELEYNQLLDHLDYIMLGIYLNRFETILKDISSKGKVDLKKIDLYFKFKNDPNVQELIDSGMLNQGFIDIIDEMLQEIEKLKIEFKDFPLEDINDYLVLKGIFSDDNSNVVHFNDYLKSLEESHNESIENNYQSLKNSFGIGNINYISDIRLIASAIGINRGINRFYETGFVPHFEPLWKDKNKETFKTYSYPFETEGIIFDLDKVKVVNWLIDNKFLNTAHVTTDEDALEILFHIKENTPEYDELKTLLHTFAHVLIRRSSLYTGLDSDSCSELLFVNTASFLIYSTSNINIGGFAFVFENSIFDWFRDVKLEVKDCVFDPTCIHETGSCFSCLYLPEYVCSEFNQSLDRDVLIGKKRYVRGFWK